MFSCSMHATWLDHGRALRSRWHHCGLRKSWCSTRANQMRVTPISILMRGGGSLLLNCARTQRAVKSISVKSIPKNDLCRMDDAPPRQQAGAVWRETHAGPWAQRHSCVPGQTEGQRAFYRRKIGGRRTKDAPG